MSVELYRVLVVDDEFYFRQLLVHLIDWPHEGFVIEQQAEHGAQALELARNTPFDVIIADINMPGMTGLQFVEALRASSIKAKVIFITSYDSFAYARKAIQLGASHYLLKPVDEEELVSALQSIRLELDHQAVQSQSLQSLIHEVERAKPMLKEQFLRALLMQGHAAELGSVYDQAARYDIPCMAGAYTVLIAELEEPVSRYSSEKEMHSCRANVKRELGKNLRMSGVFCAILDGEPLQMVALSTAQEVATITSLCEEIRSDLYDCFQQRITFALGKTHGQLHLAQLSYTEASYMLRHRFVYGGKQVLTFTEQDDPLIQHQLCDIVRKAILYIETHYSDESVTLQQTAREISVNPSYLSHIFKKDTGISFTEYLTDVRLERAMQLLSLASADRNAQHTITEVSQKVGYADPYYFTRCFKKKYGFAPSKVAERWNKNIYGNAQNNSILPV